MKYSEAIAYLTRCADANGNHWSGGITWPAEDCPTCDGTNDAGWLRCPCSRYGRTSADCAPVAYRVARIRVGSYDVPKWALDEAISQVVNDSDSPEGTIEEYVIRLAGADIDAIVDGYLDCQLWAGLDMDRDNDGNSPPLNTHYDRDDISPEYVEKIRQELTQVVLDHPLAVRMYLNSRHTRQLTHDSASFGHEFYLTREHHGAGFWDRGLGDLGDYLTDIAHTYGEAEQLYDNGEGILS